MCLFYSVFYRLVSFLLNEYVMLLLLFIIKSYMCTQEYVMLWFCFAVLLQCQLMTDRQTYKDSVYRASMSSRGNDYIWTLMMLLYGYCQHMSFLWHVTIHNNSLCAAREEWFNPPNHLLVKVIVLESAMAVFTKRRPLSAIENEITGKPRRRPPNSSDPLHCCL